MSKTTVAKSAVISSCGKYRYHLQRVWDESLPRVAWIMLNPSTADAEQDDATIRRCLGFARSWGYGGIDVVNVYAYRATNPKELRKVSDPVGSENGYWIMHVLQSEAVRLVVAAWGAHAVERGKQLAEFVSQLTRMKLHQVGDYPFPRHPLRLPSNLQPVLVKEPTR